MHHTLEIEEILFNIFGHCDCYANLAALARTYSTDLSVHVLIASCVSVRHKSDWSRVTSRTKFETELMNHVRLDL